MTAPGGATGAAGAAPAFVDLHMHSTASDGSRTPAEVVAAARDARLAAIALTDHDTVAGLEEAREAGARLGVRVVAGVELSAVEEDGETHLLGLHLEQLDELQDRLEELRTMRLTRAERMVERLNALGVTITLDDVLEQARGGALGRPHVARAMMAHGWVGDFREAFDRYLGFGRPAFVGKDQLPMAEAIDMIHRAGGLAVLAHPGESCRRDRLQSLAALGLDGVEVRHPSHSPDERRRLAALADLLGLLPSGGSDWHGTGERGRALGMMEVPMAWLTRQDEVVAQRRATR